MEEFAEADYPEKGKNAETERSTISNMGPLCADSRFGLSVELQENGMASSEDAAEYEDEVPATTLLMHVCEAVGLAFAQGDALAPLAARTDAVRRSIPGERGGLRHVAANGVRAVGDLAHVR